MLRRLLNSPDGAAFHVYGTFRFCSPSAAGKLQAQSFTIDGEAVVNGPDGVAAFDELHSRRRLSEAFLYAFDLLELNGDDLRPLPFSKRKARLTRLLGSPINFLDPPTGRRVPTKLQFIPCQADGFLELRPLIGWDK